MLSAFVLVSVSNYSQYISPFLVDRGLDIKWLGLVLASASFGDYLGTKIIKFFYKFNRNYILILLSILICVFVFLGGAWDTVLGGALGYFGINMIYSPFTILLGETINKVIDNKYRATLLSISNQFGEFFSIIIDPIIGVSIDLIGFRLVYVCLGIISIGALAIISLFVRRREV